MLDKLTPLSTPLRLLLCLTLSSGLHASIVFYKGADQESQNGVGEMPVTVALLSIDDPVKPKSAETPAQKISEQFEKQKVEPVNPAKPRSVKQNLKLSNVVPRKTVNIQPEVKSIEVAEEDVPTAEVVCEPVAAEEQVNITSQATERAAMMEPPVAETAVEDKPVLMARAAEMNMQEGAVGELQQAIPRYRINPKPEYPVVAARRRWEGVVWLLVDVSSEGLVNNLKVEQSCGYRVLDKAASRTVKKWEFVPAMRSGLPIESRVRIPVRFRLKGS